MKRIIALFALVALLLTGCSALGRSPDLLLDEELAHDRLYSLDGLDNLRSLFNADAGTARLILLLSPT